ncbi:MAG: hypothetical protein ICV63_04260 [Coleofasciculus sp. Co-bin14]|nr:hypothetical protein [Coleofasciculus sp. Co-bin14]
MTKPILYDLGIALSSISLWLTPWDITRAAGYSLSMLFSGRAYYTGVITLQREAKEDEKEAITYEAEVDFYDQLLGSNIEATLEVKALEVENRMLQRMIPLAAQKRQLEQQLQHLNPIHPELSEEDREAAAKSAIEDAFQPKQEATPSKEISEEEIRKHFPETMDATSWKAILKALQGGSSREEIIKDVLGLDNEVGKAYFEFLKRKYL